MNNGLTGTVALVTRDSPGVDAAVTRRLAEASADVAISYKMRDEEED